MIRDGKMEECLRGVQEVLAWNVWRQQDGVAAGNTGPGSCQALTRWSGVSDTIRACSHVASPRLTGSTGHGSQDTLLFPKGALFHVAFFLFPSFLSFPSCLKFLPVSYLPIWYSLKSQWKFRYNAVENLLNSMV